MPTHREKIIGKLLWQQKKQADHQEMDVIVLVVGLE